MRSSDTIELILLVPMLCDPSLLWRRYPKFDLCHQNRYLKYCEFCESSHADRKIAAVDLPFYLQGRVDRTRAGVCLAARNRKEVSGETKPYGEGLITVSIWPGVVFCRSRRGEPKCQTNRPPQRSTENSRPKFVAAYVRRNQIGAAVLISTVHQSARGSRKIESQGSPKHAARNTT